MVASVFDVYEGRAAAERQPKLIYADHFSLSSPPFSITPDTRFSFSHETQQVALNTLMVAVRSGEGFTKITGEVGTGKTLLCRQFLSALEDDYLTAYIPNPYLEPMTLLLAIADEFEIRYSHNVTQHHLLKFLNEFLLEAYKRRRCAAIICLDEAHVIPTETLEALRLISNLETEQNKLVQIFLFGQPELDVRLDDPSIRQLRQRISFSYRLGQLDAVNVGAYLAHRLTVAGYAGPKLFTEEAAHAIHVGSAGTPRLMNILAHKALLCAYGEGVSRIAVKHVFAAIEDTESAVKLKPSLNRLKLVSVVLGALVVSTAAVLMSY